jgi:hypothetical protein
MAIKSNNFAISKSFQQNKRAIESVPEFLEYVYYLQKAWGETELWFRGVSKSSYKLVPSIYRSDVWKYDTDDAKDVFFEFTRKAKACLTGSCSKWEWYHIMQHHGLPTRLLDWTDGALIALFFGTRGSRKFNRPTVWVIDPYWVNKATSGQSEIFWTESLAQDPATEKIITPYVENHELKKLPNYPICVLPPYSNDRIRAQRGCFSVHGRYVHGFESVFRRNKDPHIMKLVIRTDHTQKVKQELISVGITESTLFPDLEGIAREIKHEYQFK